MSVEDSHRSGHYRGWIRFVNRLRLVATTPHQVLGWVFAVVLVFLVAFPVYELLVRSITIQPRDLVRFPGTSVGDWTAVYWERALASQFAERAFYTPLANTLLVSISFTIMAMVLGVLLAWLVVRTDMPLKGAIGALTVLPYILPSWTLAMAWIAFFRNDTQVSAVSGVLQHVTGLAVPEWLVYGPVPMIAVLTVNYVAFAYLLAAAALATVDSALEDSAEIHGVSSVMVFLRITGPLVLPALGSAFILIFTAGLGTFGVPAYLGRPVGYEVLSTWLYGNMRIGRHGDAFVLAVVLVVMAAITVYLNSVVIGRRRQFTTISGKGSRRRPVSLGRVGWPIALVVLVSLTVAGVVPVLLLVLQSLQERLGQYSVANLTLDFWLAEEVATFFRGVLRDPRVLRAGLNTLLLGLSVGAITMVVGLMMGHVIARGRGALVSRLVEHLSFLPYIIPGVAFGAVYLSMWATPIGPFPALYGTMALVILAAAVYRLPYAARTGTAAMMQVGAELEEAARMHHASFLTTVRKVLLPLTKQGVFVGFVLVFIGVTKDLSLVIMLITSRTEVLSVVALGYNELGIEQIAYAIAVIIIVMVLVGTAIVRRLSKADPVRVFREAGGGG